jgi:hypothetical protein
VAGRALAFSDPEILRMAREEFIPVACDDWYQRRRQDAEGRFFMSVANQGRPDPNGSDTRQGIYMLTAGGKLLFYRNSQDVETMRGALEKALKQWRQLPQSDRAPGAVKVGEAGPPDNGYVRKPPEGGLIIDVFTRAVDREPTGLIQPTAVCKVGNGKEAARDHLWITREEVQLLVPPSATVGQSFDVPPDIADRILRFHLVDNTRGEPPLWARKEIRRSQMKLTVMETRTDALKLRLDGSALLSSDADPERASRGYDASLLGELTFDRQKNTFTKFDVVALGDNWGEGTYTPGARPGREPLGVVFQLAHGDLPANSVPPQGARESGRYFHASRRDEE